MQEFQEEPLQHVCVKKRGLDKSRSLYVYCAWNYLYLSFCRHSIYSEGLYVAGKSLTLFGCDLDMPGSKDSVLWSVWALWRRRLGMRTPRWRLLNGDSEIVDQLDIQTAEKVLILELVGINSRKEKYFKIYHLHFSRPSLSCLQYPFPILTGSSNEQYIT